MSDRRDTLCVCNAFVKRSELNALNSVSRRAQQFIVRCWKKVPGRVSTAGKKYGQLRLKCVACRDNSDGYSVQLIVEWKTFFVGDVIVWDCMD